MNRQRPTRHREVRRIEINPNWSRFDLVEQSSKRLGRIIRGGYRQQRTHMVTVPRQIAKDIDENPSVLGRGIFRNLTDSKTERRSLHRVRKLHGLVKRIDTQFKSVRLEQGVIERIDSARNLQLVFAEVMQQVAATGLREFARLDLVPEIKLDTLHVQICRGFYRCKEWLIETTSGNGNPKMMHGLTNILTETLTARRTVRSVSTVQKNSILFSPHTRFHVASHVNLTRISRRYSRRDLVSGSEQKDILILADWPPLVTDNESDSPPQSGKLPFKHAVLDDYSAKNRLVDESPKRPMFPAVVKARIRM